MGTTIDQLQIEVEASSSNAEQKLDSLTKTLEKLDKVSKSSGLDKTCKKLEKIASLNFSNLSPLTNLSNITSPVSEISEQISEMTSAMSDIPSEIGTTFDTSGIENAVDEIGEISSAVNDVPNGIETTVSTPGAETANANLSHTHRILGMLHSGASATGRGLIRLGGYLKQLGVSAVTSLKKAHKSISQVLNIVLIYGGAFRAVMMITQGLSEGLQNVAKYNNETADSMNKLSTMSLYLKNSIGAALYPVIVAITPALEAMTNAIIRALNAFNQFIAAWNGSTSFIKANKVLKEYGETAKSTANKVKRSFAGFDEITVIGQNNGGSSSSTPDYSSMFETVPVSDESAAVVENLKANLDNIKAILGAAALAVGAILVFSGANVPLGLGLMALGGYMLGSAVAENWESTTGTLQDQFTNVMFIVSGALLLLGAILTFVSPLTRPLGIALLAAGALVLATAVAENWDGLPQNIKNVITIIGLAIGVALLVLGTILTFSGAATPLGIGLMIGGAAELATVAVLGWNTIPDNVKNTISIILAAVSAALLVIGIILCVTGAGIPLGIALIVLGAVGLATAVAVNWDWVKDKTKTVLSAVLAIISGFGLVLGILLCFTGAGIPLGIALIMGSIKGVKAASDINDNPVTRFVKKMVNGIIDIFERGVNFIIKMLNKLSWQVPDWVPSIGGSTFGFNIKPVSIPRLKNGGFPDGEDGLFYANHTELVGKFSNGKTAVANNAQIVDGIYRGVLQAMRDSKGDGRQPIIVMLPNGDVLAETVYEHHNGVVKQTGNSPLLV